MNNPSKKQDFNRETAKYVYILVRTDLSIEQQSVQAIHAGMAATHKFKELSEDTRLALLAVPSEKELEGWMHKLTEKGIAFEPFFEPDYETGYSALATIPISSTQGRCMKSLNLWSPALTLKKEMPVYLTLSEDKPILETCFD